MKGTTMEITLQTVREVLRKSFGRESFIAAFITRVEAAENCATAGIDSEGILRYNPAFADEYITDPESLFCLIAHELMHPMFGHFVYGNGQLENIGADMVINAAISLFYPGPSGQGALFRKCYTRRDIEGLLRPDSDMRHSRYAALYHAFYSSRTSGSKLSTGEVIQSLKVLTPVEEIPAVMLLGDHDKPGTGSGASAGNGGKAGLTQAERETSGDGSVPDFPGCSFPADIVSRIAEDLRRAAEKPAGQHGGHGEMLYGLFLDVLKTHMSLKRALLERYTTDRKVDRFRKMLSRPRIGVSPIPIRPSKRDFVLLAAGVPPFHYHNVAYRQATQERGLAVYLDVSGSVNQHLPEIIGLLRSLRTELKSIFLFSNKVVEAPFRTLLTGQVQTTYGTDFDCIAEHVLANRFDKAVVLTDGYASMTEENQKQLKARAFRALTVLFGGKRECPEFEALGDVVQLEEVTG
jgi:hypothetical protein